jgi:hypothetical protein
MTTFHDKLIHELTAMDRKDSTRPGYNHYALAQYFEAAEGVYDAASFAEAFNPTRGMHGVARRLGLALDVERGRWVIKS